MNLKFYRGIAVEPAFAEETIKAIRDNGINGDEGRWSFSIPDVIDTRKCAKKIFSSDNPSIGDLFDSSLYKGICACGDEGGARYYSVRHNRTKEKTVPIVVSFIADTDRVYVDCRDFLCTIFQLWDRHTLERIKLQKKYLRELYGAAVIPYFDKSITTTDQKVRIAMGNLAAFDEKVVLSHYRNSRLIGGRHGTRFHSAFFIQAPVTAAEIISCEVVDDKCEDQEVFIDIPRFLGEHQ